MVAVSTDQVVGYLLSNNYLLTALELFMEACEAGREGEVEPLHKLFRDPARFPPEEVARHNPTGALSVQSMARQREQRLAMLEYELRVAQEDVRELRGGQHAEHAEHKFDAPQQNGSTPTLGPTAGEAVAAQQAEGGMKQRDGAGQGGGACLAAGGGEGVAAAVPGQEGLSSAERREVVVAVRAFLTAQGYKLTAMTLAEESGGSTPRGGRAQHIPATPPASLVQWYRAQQAQQTLSRQLEEAEAAVKRHGMEMAILKHQLAEVQLQLERETAMRLTTRADLEFVQGKLRYKLAQQGQQNSCSPATALAGTSPQGQAPIPLPGLAAGAAGTEGGGTLAMLAAAASAAPGSGPSPSGLGAQSKAAPAGGGSPFPGSSSPVLLPGLLPTRKRSISLPSPPNDAASVLAALGSGSLFVSQRQPNEEDDGLLTTDSDFSILGVEGALDEVANCLPNILPNVLINKREELIPMLLAVCQEHPSPQTRRRTAALLFDLIKKPNSAQRALIATACTQLARRIGSARTALELLPHVCSQVSHEHIERRIVVGETLARLAPHVPPLDCGTVLLGGVQALAADAHPQVRAVASAALGSLAAALPDVEPYPQLQALVLQLAGDESQEVVNELLQQALPALLRKMEAAGLLTSQLLPQVLSQLQGVLQRCPYLAGTDESSLVSGTALLRAVPDQAQRQAAVLLQVYMAALPALRSAALHAAPDWVVAWADRLVDGFMPQQPQEQKQQPPTQLSAAAAAAAGSLPPPLEEGALEEPALEPTPSGCHPLNPFLAPPPRAERTPLPGSAASETRPPFSCHQGAAEGQPGTGASCGEGQQQQGAGVVPALLSLAPPPAGSNLGASEQPTASSNSPLGSQGPMPSPLPALLASLNDSMGSEADSGSAGTASMWASSSGGASGGFRPGRSALSDSANLALPNSFAGPRHLRQVAGLGRALTAPEGLAALQAGGKAPPPTPLPRALSVPGGTGAGPKGLGSTVPGSGPSITPQQLEASNAFSPLRHLPFGGRAASGEPAPAVAVRQLSLLGDGAPLNDAPSPSLSTAISTTRTTLHTCECTSASSQEGRGRQSSRGMPGMTATPHAQQRLLLWEAAAFGAWAAAEQHTEWHAVEYMAAEAVPLLVRAAMLVAPTRDTLQLRHKLVSAFKATCIAFGPSFARDVVEPALLAASGVPDWRPSSVRTSPHAAAVAHKLSPCSAEAERAGRCTALPMLLAGVLGASPGACDATKCVQQLAQDGGTGAVWALMHPHTFVEAVRFAADPPQLQSALLEVMWELAVQRGAQARLSASLLAGALAPVLHVRQVSRQLLPAIVTLAADAEVQVCSAGMAAAAEVFRAFPTDQPLQDALLGELDSVLGKRGHVSEVALLRALGPLACSASEAQVLWLLQRAQLMMANMHQRASCGRTRAQLAEACCALFDMLRLVEAHEFTSQQGMLHFAAALQALQRECDLLEFPQRDALAAMLADHATPPQGLAQRPGSAGGSGASPSLNSFLPGARSAALPSGATLSTVAHQMGSGCPTSRPTATPTGQSGAADTLGQQAYGTRGGTTYWGVFRGWQYGAQ